MSQSVLPVPSVPMVPETQAFWEAALDGQLRLQRCATCSSVIWYPRTICPACGSADISWVDSPGAGVVYSFTVVRRGDGPFKDVTPYVLAYVELDEGVRLLTNVVGCAVEDVAVGMRVVAVFERGEGEAVALRFRPIVSAPAST